MKLFSGFKRTLIEILECCDFIDHPRKKLSCDTTVKNNMEYLKLNVIRPNNVLGSKHKRESRCTYAPTIEAFRQPSNYVRKNDRNVYSSEYG